MTLFPIIIYVTIACEKLHYLEKALIQKHVLRKEPFVISFQNSLPKNLTNPTVSQIAESGHGLESDSGIFLGKMGYGRQKETLNQSLTKETLEHGSCIFDNSVLNSCFLPSELSHFHLYSEVDCILSVGPASCGLSWHSHPEAYSMLIKGQKKWFFLPPDIRIPEEIRDLSPKKWIETSWPLWKSDPDASLIPRECVQNPGDVVYVPGNKASSTCG